MAVGEFLDLHNFKNFFLSQSTPQEGGEMSSRAEQFLGVMTIILSKPVNNPRSFVYGGE